MYVMELCLTVVKFYGGKQRYSYTSILFYMILGNTYVDTHLDTFRLNTELFNL